MSSFNDALALGIVGNACFKRDERWEQKLRKVAEVYPGPLSVLMVFGVPIMENAARHCAIQCQAASTVCKEAKIYPEKVSILT